MNIILCGLPLSGKSHFAKLLSEYLGWPLIDTDRQLEKLYKTENKQSLTASDIYRLKGETFFRDLERRAIASISHSEKTIIALGGGALTNPDNVSVIKQLGTLIYLETEIDVLIERMKKKNEIPAYLNAKDPENSFRQLAKSRIPVYESYSDATVNTKGLKDIEVVASICRYMLN